MPRTATATRPAIRYLTTRRGSRLAWASAGIGSPALVRVGGWVSHLLLDWQGRETGSFLNLLAQRRRVVIYDRPGVGLSDRASREFALEDQLDHLRLVIEAAGEDPVTLFASPFAGPVAIAFAAMHPKLVSRLVLFGTAPRLVETERFVDAFDAETARAIVQLIRREWGLASRTIADLMMPNASPELERWYADYQVMAAEPESLAEMIEQQLELDALDLLQQVRAPVLILHRQDDRAIPVRAAERMAELLPNARVHVFGGAATLPFAEDQRAVAQMIDDFVGCAPRLRVVGETAGGPATALSRRELEVARLIAAGLRNREIGERLHLSERTVESHVGGALNKLGYSSRSQLAAWAAARGLTGAASAT